MILIFIYFPQVTIKTGNTYLLIALLWTRIVEWITVVNKRKENHQKFMCSQKIRSGAMWKYFCTDKSSLQNLLPLQLYIDIRCKLHLSALKYEKITTFVHILMIYLFFKSHFLRRDEIKWIIIYCPVEYFPVLPTQNLQKLTESNKTQTSKIL